MTARQHKGRAEEVLDRYGQCLELVAVDPHFHEITVGLYEKDGVLTVWSYSGKSGVHERLRQIRDRLVSLGGLSPIEGTSIQARLPCGDVHLRPLRLLIAQAVEKSPDSDIPTGEIVIRDLRSPLLLRATPREEHGRWAYAISAEGEAERPELRVRATVAGLIRRGDMQLTGPNELAFSCGARHDELVRLLLPYARNLRAVQDELEGQMTTQTLGFSSSV